MDTEAEILLKSVREICPYITADELSQYASKLTFQELNKKDFFLHSGKIQKALGFVTKGLVRSSFVDNDGDEITVGFYAEGHYATHYPSFITQQPSKYNIQCLEPTTMVCISYEDLQWVYENVDFNL
jgi:CRP/FNR family transcriptional regulator, anaerobic regulatory protein